MLLDFQESAVSHSVNQLSQGKDAVVVIERGAGRRTIGREVIRRLGAIRKIRALVVYASFESQNRTAQAYRYAPWPSAPMRAAAAETQRELHILLAADPDILLIRDDLVWGAHTISPHRDILIIQNADSIKPARALRALHSAPSARLLLFTSSVDSECARDILSGYPGQRGCSKREEEERESRFRSALFAAPKGAAKRVTAVSLPRFIPRSFPWIQPQQEDEAHEQELVFQYLHKWRASLIDSGQEKLTDVDSVIANMTRYYKRQPWIPRRSGQECCPCCNRTHGERHIIHNLIVHISNFTLTWNSTPPLWTEKKVFTRGVILAPAMNWSYTSFLYDDGRRWSSGVSRVTMPNNFERCNQLAETLMRRGDTYAAVGTAFARPQKVLHSRFLSQLIGFPWFLRSIRDFLEPQLVVIAVMPGSPKITKQVAAVAPFVTGIAFPFPPVDVRTTKTLVEKYLGPKMHGRPSVKVIFDVRCDHFTEPLKNHLMTEVCEIKRCISGGNSIELR